MFTTVETARPTANTVNSTARLKDRLTAVILCPLFQSHDIVHGNFTVKLTVLPVLALLS